MHKYKKIVISVSECFSLGVNFSEHGNEKRVPAPAAVRAARLLQEWLGDGWLQLLRVGQQPAERHLGQHRQPERLPGQAAGRPETDADAAVADYGAGARARRGHVLRVEDGAQRRPGLSQ